MKRQKRNTFFSLGMTIGTGRAAVEKRVCGICSKKRTAPVWRVASLLFWTAMGFSCLAAACQPTPEAPVVVDRREDIPRDAILTPSETQVPEAEDAIEPAQYSVMGHWTETVEKNKFLAMNINADIYMPDVTAYPVERLERVTLTQERVNELIAYFTKPGVKFYTGEDVRLKSEYEEDLIYAKQNLQKVLNGGDGETPESIRAYIKELEKKMANAPETYTYTYVEPVFTFPTDYETGEPRKEEGENSIYVSIEWPDGSRHGSIGATRYEKDKNTSSSFHFSNISGGYDVESYFTWYDGYLKQEEENPPAWANAEWEQDIKRQRDFVNNGLKRMQSNTMDLDVAKQQAVGLLEELGIRDMQLISYEKAMFAREKTTEFKDHLISGCYVTFARECGGIPSATQNGGSFSREQDYSELYCAPFGLESVSVLISGEGVEQFEWRGIAQIAEHVTGHTKLIPLEELKQDILNHIYFMNAAWVGGQHRGKIRINISEVRLHTTYINAKDDPERVLIVPAWMVKTQDERLYDDMDAWMQGNQAEFMINALDGSGILMPGMLDMIKGP